MMSIAEQYFAPAEIAKLQRLADPTAAFFECWTLKEACLKANGTGLICDLDSFEITYGLEDEPIAIHFGSRKEMPCWSLYKLTPHH
jgi:4'-phosphopantetheinyl transferase